MKLTSTRYNAEALLPDWLFTNQLHINEDHRKKVLNAELNSPRTPTKWGWTRKGLAYHQETMKLAKLVGSQFVDIMLNHFQCEQNGRYIRLPNGVVTDVEFTHMCTYGIKPDHDLYLVTEPAFYRAFCFLDSEDETSHKIQIYPTHTLNNPFMAFSTSIIRSPQQLKVLYVPGVYHINFHDSESHRETVIYQANIMLKKIE